MKKTILLLSLIISVLSGFAWGQANRIKPNASKNDEKLFDYEMITLDNGMDVITLEDFSTPIVAVQVWYGVGSKNEKPDRQGYAHLFEHMMFKGTDRVSEQDFFNLLRRVGGTNNAYTSFDQTVYHETLPADQIELALWLEAERMGFLRIDQHAFDTERNVVEEELRMGENQPYGNVFKKMAAVIFKDSAYSWTPIGNISHLRSTSVEDLRQFWNKYYVPNNATLIIVGAIEHNKAQKLAEEYFGWMPKEPVPAQQEIARKEIAESKTAVIDDENAPAGQVSLAWKTVPTGTRDETVLDFLSEILGGGRSSRVYRALVAQSQMAVEAGTGTYNLQKDGVFMAQATLAPDKTNYEQLIDALKDQIVKIQEQGITDDEVEKARNQLLKRLVTTNLEIESKASLLGRAAVTMGDVSKVNKFMDEIRSVTKQDIQQAAVKYLKVNRAYQFIIKQNPGMEQASKDEETASTAAPELQAPRPGRPGFLRPGSFPAKPPMDEVDVKGFKIEYEDDKLPNGINIKVVSNHEVPFVSVTLGLPHGAWTESKPATASMTMQMLPKGTKNHTEAELAQALEQYAIDLNASSDMDTSTITLNSLKEHMDKGMALLAEVVQTPTFDNAEFVKLSQQQITALQIQQQDPEYIANTTFHKIIFNGHPYGRPVNGTPEDLKQLTTDDLKLWWSKFGRPDKATLIFAGDITKKEAAAMAAKYLGDWKTDLVETGMILPDIPKPAATKIYLVDRPGSAQAQILAGHLGITRRQQPDYFVSLIAGNYFAGSFHSRINDTIRVQKGLSYAAFGGYRPMAMAGTFEISTFTKNASAAEAIEVIIQLVREFETVPPTESEFSDSRSFFLGSFARNRETPQEVARDLWMIASQGLSDDYFKKLFNAIDKMDKRDCLILAQKTVNPLELAIVVVGDASQLQPELSKVAEVQVVEAEK